MWAAIATVLEAILGSLAKALLSWQQDANRIQANRDAAVSGSEATTEDVIAGIADDQKAIVRSDDPDELARRLSERANGAGPDGTDRG